MREAESRSGEFRRIGLALAAWALCAYGYGQEQDPFVGAWKLVASQANQGRWGEARTGDELVCIHAHGDDIDAAAVSPDGGVIASCSHDRTVRLWATANGRTLGQIDAHGDEVEWVAWSPDGRRIATASLVAGVRIFDADTGECLSVLEGHTREVSALCWAADGRLVTGSRDGTLRVWDVARGRARAVLPHAPGAARGV